MSGRMVNVDRLVNFQVVDTDDGGADAFPSAVMWPGSDIDGHVLRDDQWGIALGDPNALCLVIAGFRDEIHDVLRGALDELLGYYRAEHENGYHRKAPEARCPECAPGEMACPECDQADDRNGWANLGSNDDIVRCGSCRHEWNPFERPTPPDPDDEDDVPAVTP